MSASNRQLYGRLGAVLVGIALAGLGGCSQNPIADPVGRETAAKTNVRMGRLSDVASEGDYVTAAVVLSREEDLLSKLLEVRVVENSSDRVRVEVRTISGDSIGADGRKPSTLAKEVLFEAGKVQERRLAWKGSEGLQKRDTNVGDHEEALIRALVYWNGKKRVSRAIELFAYRDGDAFRVSMDHIPYVPDSATIVTVGHDGSIEELPHR